MTKTNADYKYIADVLAKHCFFQSRRDVKMGGKKIYEQRTVAMPKDLRRTYDKLEKEYILEYPGVEQITTWAPTKHLWLRRMCAGFIDEVFVSTYKIDELCTLLEGELREQQVVIWCKHTEELLQISGRFKKRKWKHALIYGKIKAGKQRDERMEAFQKGKIQYLVCQPKCFRYGVDLSAATTVVYYTSPDSYEERQQSEDRVIDVVHNDTVLVIDLVASNTVEVEGLESLLLKEGKQERMKRIVSGIRRRTSDALPQT
jgi:SNF2 family DNA or RNA helicase